MTIAVVTGSSTGIGYATALRLARVGHHVVATMRTPDACDIGSVSSAEGLSLETRALDVTNDDMVASIFHEIGDVDILVNNAGIEGGGTFEDTSVEDFARVMDTNFYGVVRCTKAVLPAMRERGSGCIVTVTSQAGRLAVPTMPAYSASKWAAEAALESLAAEVASFGVRVVMIEPGAIITAIIGKASRPPSDGPYAPLWVRFMQAAFHDFGQGSMPDVVADCIAESIVAEPWRLRWLTGQGAERNIANRAAMTDEEAVAAWQLDGDEFFKTWIGE